MQTDQATTESNQYGILGTFAKHKLAAHVLMLIMLGSGFYALSKLNRQFFPSFELENISIRVVWPGSNPEDVEKSITNPIEEAIRSVDNIKKVTSTSASGVAAITIEFVEGTEMIESLDRVKQRVSELRNLPQDAEEPVIQRVVRYESVGRILLTAEATDLSELRLTAYQIENQLLDLGIDRVSFTGLPELQMRISMDEARLQTLGMTLAEIAQIINRSSRDVPVGSIGEQDITRDLRVLAQGRSVEDFSEIVLRSNASEVIRLGDVSTIELIPKDEQVLLYSGNKRGIELAVQRVDGGDTLAAAEKLLEWERLHGTSLRERMDVVIFDRYWIALEQRIGVLLKNGLSGLLLVILILYVFMNTRVAMWVTIGIPTSFMFTLMLLYWLGGSINMLSVFALIMALGIIVDDAIVVGEHALQRFEDGQSPLQAAMSGAHRMLPPVFASSATTIAAFLPLLLVSGFIGKFLIALPIVVICVIIASLIESFLVLPGHLNHSFAKMNRKIDPNGWSSWRIHFDRGFNAVRQGIFAKFVALCLRHRLIVVALVFSVLILSVGVIRAGLVKFDFLPSPEGRKVFLQASFISGTPKNVVEDYLRLANDALDDTVAQLGDNIIDVRMQRLGLGGGNRGSYLGENVGSIFLELTDPDTRNIRNLDLIKAWRKNLPTVADLENLTITQSRAGPPGSDVSYRIVADNSEQAKQAAEALKYALNQLSGISNVTDDQPYGRDQFIFTLSEQAHALGLSVENISAQLRNIFASRLVQIYTNGKDEIEVRIQLESEQTNQLSALDGLSFQLPNGRQIPLANLVTWSSRQGFETIRHYNAQVAVEINADLDTSLSSLDVIEATMEKDILPEIVNTYGINWAPSGRVESQKETFADMRTGAVVGLVIIYIVLAWVFASWGWPLLIILAIPFGLIGTVLGHLVLGLNMSILSLFGLFGLSGIVINDSIVLVTAYRKLREAGMPINEALVEASKSRLRAVLLTSLTTIGGLVPLLFETSLQAQFLIPMAATIAFGLAVATILILAVVPVLLSLYEESAEMLGRLFSRKPKTEPLPDPVQNG